MKKRRGFTLVELLVVIAIIALLMGILMPALAKVRQIAYRMVCGANLAGIGKAMMAYANENNESYPLAGLGGQQFGKWSSDGKIQAWYELTLTKAFLRRPSTITACHYLIVRTQEGTPKQFVCKGDVGTMIYTLKDGKPDPPSSIGLEMQNCWDFGSTNWPGRYSSYAYHMPFYHNLTTDSQFRSFPMTTSSNSGSPILADRNPYNDKNADSYIDGRSLGEKAPSWDQGDPQANPPVAPHYSDQYKTGNSACHQREGQNVMFNDNRVDFAKFPNVGIDNDNIWKYWGTITFPTPEQKQLLSTSPAPGAGGFTDGVGGPMSDMDAYLVAEDNRRTQ